MYVKVVNVRASQVTAGKALSSLKSHLKYIQYRERDPLREAPQDRYLFNETNDHVERKDIHAQMMREPAGDIYYHRMILSPADSEPVQNWQEWTRAVMGDLEQRLGMHLDWYAAHHENTDHPHMHVVIGGTGQDRESGRDVPVTFAPADFRAIKESGREHSDYEHYRLIQETMQELDTHDTVTKETIPREPQRDQGRDDDR
jgi:hypothetical protein